MLPTLVDIAASSLGNIKQSVIETIIDESPILSMLPIEDKPGLRHIFFREAALPDVGARRINQSYNKTKGTFEQLQQDLVPVGGEFDIDNKLKRIPTVEGVDQATKQLQMHSRATALVAKKFALTGEPGNGEPPGLRHWFTEYTNQNLLYGGATNVAGEAIDDAQEFIEQMNRLDRATLGMPDMYVSNEQLAFKVDALVSVGGNSQLTTLFQWKEIEIRPGMSIKVASWRGKPWVFSEDDHLEQEILAFDELNPDGVANDTSSIYAVRTRGDMFKMLQDRAPEVVRDPGTTSDSWAIDWAIATVPEHKRAIARLRGILEA